jgi:hypothetical protein
MEEYKCGGSPGLHINPLLFLLLINDIVTDIKASIQLFADKTSFYVTVDSPQNAADIMNRDLEKIHQWSVNWLVKLNPQKINHSTPIGNEQSNSSTRYKS